MTKSSLSENQLFTRFSQTELDGLIDISIEKTYPEDQWITHYGSDWPYLFLVEKGQVTALKESPEGRSLVVITLEQGELFWGVGFFKEGVGMPVALVAKQETRLRLWSREKLEPFMIDNGQFTWDLAQLMAERMMLASRILEELAFQPVAGRLAIKDYYSISRVKENSITINDKTGIGSFNQSLFFFSCYSNRGVLI